MDDFWHSVSLHGSPTSIQKIDTNLSFPPPWQLEPTTSTNIALLKETTPFYRCQLPPPLKFTHNHFITRDLNINFNKHMIVNLFEEQSKITLIVKKLY